MYTLLLILFLLLSGGLLFLLKSNPGLKPATYVLPVLALLLFVFRPGPSERSPITNTRFQRQIAARTGEQLALALRLHLSGPGPVLVFHPENASTAFRQLHGTRLLDGIEQPFTLENRTVTFYPLPEMIYVDLPTLNQALKENPGTAGIILAGLQIMSDEDILTADLPPIVLSDLGDPASSEWALEHGVAVAALFHQDAAHPAQNNITPEAYFDTRLEFRFTARNP